MPSLAEMRKELKELRKASKEHAPVSKLKKADVASALEKMKSLRETTPAPAAVPSAAPRKMVAKAANVKESKAKEHPVAPAAVEKKKKGMSKSALMALLNEMSDSDEE